MRCYILCGGLSTRMGASKETLKLAGETFLNRVVAAASPVFEEVLIVDREDRPRAARTIVEPPHDEASPLFGIRAAIADADTRGDEKLWVIAVDYPVITSDLLAKLRRQFESSAAEFFVPVADGNPHMLCAGYSTAMLSRITDRIRRREFVLRHLFDESRTVFVEADARRLRNVNTPEDYRELALEHVEADASR